MAGTLSVRGRDSEVGQGQGDESEETHVLS